MGLRKEEVAAMSAYPYHQPHFDGRKPSIKAAALMSAGGAAIETGLFWADPRDPELKVTYGDR